MIERKVGEVFEHRHKRFIITELKTTCKECRAKTNKELCVKVGECRSWLRSDYKSVVCKPYIENEN